MVGGGKPHIEVLTSLLNAFLLLIYPVSLLLLRVIVTTVNIVVDVLGGTLSRDLLFQICLFLLLSDLIVLFVLQVDDIEVPAAVQFLLRVLFGQDYVTILQVIITEFLPVDQVVDIPDGGVVWPWFGGGRVGRRVSEGMEGDDVVGFIVIEVFGLNGKASTMYLFKERSICTVCSFSRLGSCVL